MSLSENELQEKAKALRREYNRKYQREWRKKNRTRLKIYQREWRKAHPEKVRKYTQNHWKKRALEELKNDNEGAFPKQTPSRILGRDSRGPKKRGSKLKRSKNKTNSKQLKYFAKWLLNQY